MNFDTHLSYDPDLDRLMGGDFFHDLQGRPLKSILLPLQRAQYLVGTMNAFAAAYNTEFGAPDDRGSPYPIALAVIELNQFPVTVYGQEQSVPIDELFTADALTIAPSDYLSLGQLVTMVVDRRTVEQTGPGSKADLEAFARQMAALIRCAHQLVGAALSRGSGTCVQPSYLSPRGDLNDLYFLTISDEVPLATLRANQRVDLRHAFDILVRLSSGDRDLCAASLGAALQAYAGARDVTSELTKLAASVAAEQGNASEGERKGLARLATLAEETLGTYL
jgi:hypothetical protein